MNSRGCTRIAPKRIPRSDRNAEHYLDQFIDSSVRPRDDSVHYAGGKWLREHPIPKSERSWAVSDVIQQETYQRLLDLRKSAAATNGQDAKLTGVARTMSPSEAATQQATHNDGSLGALTDVRRQRGWGQEMERAKQDAHGLGIFVRSLVGLDRGAAKDALGTFLDGKRLSAIQIEFVDMIVMTSPSTAPWKPHCCTSRHSPT